MTLLGVVSSALSVNAPVALPGEAGDTRQGLVEKVFAS